MGGDDMIRAITLSDPARGLSSVVTPRTGVAYQGHEFTATVRDVTEDRASADGADDTSQWLGAGAVTLNLALLPPNRALLDEFARYLAPFARPYLLVDDDEWATPRQVRLRFTSHNQPIETGKGLVRYVQYQWVAPDGVWEDTATQIWNINADTPDTTGLVFTDASGVSVTDASGFVFPASTSSGTTRIQVSGNLRPRWRVRLYGPATGPKLTRDDTGLSVAFTDALILAAGHFIEFDSELNLLRNGVTPAFQYVDWDNTTWPLVLDPGENDLRYHGTSASAGAQAEVTAYPKWLPV